jgi:hypothetical protein
MYENSVMIAINGKQKPKDKISKVCKMSKSSKKSCKQSDSTLIHDAKQKVQNYSDELFNSTKSRVIERFEKSQVKSKRKLDEVTDHATKFCDEKLMELQKLAKSGNSYDKTTAKFQQSLDSLNRKVDKLADFNGLREYYNQKQKELKEEVKINFEH